MVILIILTTVTVTLCRNRSWLGVPKRKVNINDWTDEQVDRLMEDIKKAG